LAAPSEEKAFLIKQEYMTDMFKGLKHLVSVDNLAMHGGVLKLGRYISSVVLYMLHC